MPTAGFYVDKEHHDKWMAIVNKRQWVEQHLDTDIQREYQVDYEHQDNAKRPNVPRPDFVSVFQWNQHLRDNGFVVEG